ncbi:hypothetical protein EJI01_28460 [Variovorax sp. MHTC-1]|nr:hypothetical protein EJI01_28460 [Variovorax sp. MHTC-1]
MSKHTLFAYIEGADLEEIEEELEAKLVDFVKKRAWKLHIPWVVNQRGSTEGLRDGDLPTWDLGLNLILPDTGREPEGWFSDVEQIAQFAGGLHSYFGRVFIIGLADAKTGITEDLFDVDSDAPDLVLLRQVIGVDPPKIA